MKRILILGGILLTNSSIAQKTLADFNLNGNVRQITEVYSSIEGNWPNDTITYTFFPSGILQKETAQSNDMSCSLQKTYDNKGNIILEKCADCTHKREWTNQYNSDSLLSQIQGNYKWRTTTFSYSKLNQLIKTEMIDSTILAASYCKETIEFDYDRNGNLISKTTFRGAGLNDSLVLKSKIINTYNDAGNLISSAKTVLEPDQSTSSFSAFETYEYDEIGNPISHEITQSNGYITTTSYSYLNGRLTAEIATISYENDNGGRSSYKDEKRYDSCGNLIYSAAIVVFDSSYQYDSRGNWTEEITFLDGEPFARRERTISYH